MDPRDTPLIEAAIARLNIDYWYDVDRHEGRSAHLFYVEGGTFRTSLRERAGRDEIAAFYRGRQDGRIRTARHLVSNLRVTVQSAETAEADWVLSLHAADGAPVLPSIPAIMIADVHDTCRLEPDGRWRYVSRIITAVFKSDSPTTG